MTSYLADLTTET